MKGKREVDDISRIPRADARMAAEHVGILLGQFANRGSGEATGEIFTKSLIAASFVMTTLVSDWMST